MAHPFFSLWHALIDSRSGQGIPKNVLPRLLNMKVLLDVLQLARIKLFQAVTIVPSRYGILVINFIPLQRPYVVLFLLLLVDNPIYVITIYRCINMLEKHFTLQIYTIIQETNDYQPTLKPNCLRWALRVR